MSDTISTKAVLKAYFETGDKPTQSQFDDLISTMVGMGTDTVVEVSASGETSINTTDSGKTYVVTADGNAQINLPSVAAGNIGIWFQF